MSQMKDPITTEEVKNFKEVFESHWAEHPDYPVEDWREEVQADDTRLGYWEWVYKQEVGDDLLVAGVAEKALADREVLWALQELQTLVESWLENVGHFIDNEEARKRRLASRIIDSVISRLKGQSPEYRCPDCGHDKLAVKAEVSVHINQFGDSEDIDTTDSYFDSDSHAVCQGCFTEGPLKKFRA